MIFCSVFFFCCCFGISKKFFLISPVTAKATTTFLYKKIYIFFEWNCKIDWNRSKENIFSAAEMSLTIWKKKIFLCGWMEWMKDEMKLKEAGEKMYIFTSFHSSLVLYIFSTSFSGTLSLHQPSQWCICVCVEYPNLLSWCDSMLNFLAHENPLACMWKISFWKHKKLLRKKGCHWQLYKTHWFQFIFLIFCVEESWCFWDKCKNKFILKNGEIYALVFDV